MSRRGDPERVYAAQRACIFAWPIQGEHADELRTEHVIAHWERTAETDGINRSRHASWALAWR